MKQSESALQAQLIRELRTQLRGSIVFKHVEKITSGIPDLSVSWLGRTTWLEIKFANPTLKTNGIQMEITQKLEIAGACYFVIYYASPRGYDTFIVSPSAVDNWKQGLYSDNCYRSDGIDHQFVVDFLKELHRRTMGS